MPLYGLARPYVRLNEETEGRWVDIDIDIERDNVTFIGVDGNHEVFRLSMSRMRYANLGAQMRAKQRKANDGHND